jgi:hypothetical protein
MIKTIMVSMVILIVLGWVVNAIGASMPSTYGATTTTTLTNTSFTTDASANWDNASAGATDNIRLQWDNWGTADNAVWDNTGPQPVLGTRTATWTRWYQTLTVPACDQVTSATVTASYLLSDNTETENLSLYVYLERPTGDNVEVLLLENTASLFVADNSTFTTVDNNVTTQVNAGGAGVYTLFLCDNIDRVALADDGSDNYVGFVWTAADLNVQSRSIVEYTGVMTALVTYGPTIVTMIFIGLFILAVAALIQYLRM